MDMTVARLNIEHYRKLLSEITDEAKRQEIVRLLNIEEASLEIILKKANKMRHY
jgi:hypothetical protein